MTSINIGIGAENLGERPPLTAGFPSEEQITEPLPSEGALTAVPLEELPVLGTIHEWPESSNEAVVKAVQRDRIIQAYQRRSARRAVSVYSITLAYAQAALLSADQCRASSAWRFDDDQH